MESSAGSQNEDTQVVMKQLELALARQSRKLPNRQSAGLEKRIKTAEELIHDFIVDRGVEVSEANFSTVASLLQKGRDYL